MDRQIIELQISEWYKVETIANKWRENSQQTAEKNSHRIENGDCKLSSLYKLILFRLDARPQSEEIRALDILQLLWNTWSTLHHWQLLTFVYNIHLFSLRASYHDSVGCTQVCPWCIQCRYPLHWWLLWNWTLPYQSGRRRGKSTWNDSNWIFLDFGWLLITEFCVMA